MSDKNIDSTSTPPESAHHDLASAVNATKEFSGTPAEDVYIWEQEIVMYKELFNLNENQTKKLIASKLRGKAQTWLSIVIRDSPWFSPQDIMNALKKQFANTDILHQKLNKFLSTKEAQTKEELNKMLELADDLFQRNAINETSLIKLSISKCPANLRPLLVKHCYNDGEWFSFLREARENTWIAYINEINHSSVDLIPQQSLFEIKQYNKKYDKSFKKGGNSKWCQIHKTSKHSTDECRLKKELEKRNLKIVPIKKVNALEEENNDCGNTENDIINKNSFNYIFSIHTDNFFIVNLILSNRQYLPALLDTGAEISLIEKKYIPLSTRILHPTNIPTIISASGNYIPILGSCTLDVIINNNKYSLHTYVTEFKLDKIIIGQNFILRNRQILIDLLQKKNIKNLKNDKKKIFPLLAIKSNQISFVKF
ncbi:hypothetical protein COBT_003348 [Conglomerata obtusa]